MHLLAASPLDPLYYAIGWLLSFFYTFIPSLGVATILLTLAVMLVQFPLIAKQTRSMIQMQRVQPEIKKIQQKYKDDRTKQNEELLKFYQENKINPLAGCLPLLVIFPIGIAVFRTFSQGVQRHIPQSGRFDSLYHAICTKGTIVAGHAQAAAHTPKPVPIKTDLSACSYALNHYPKGKTPAAFRFLSMNLNWSAREAQQQLGSFVQWLPYLVLIGLVIFTGWYQVRQTQARQLRQGNTPPNNQMQAITRIMPIVFGFITFGLNTATTLYFVVSNAWRIGQTHFVLNNMYDEAVASGEIKDTKHHPEDKEPPDKKPPPKDASPPKSGSKTKPADQNGSPPSGNGASSTQSNAARRKKKRKR